MGSFQPSTFKPPPAPILLRPALLHNQQHILRPKKVEAVGTAIDMLLSGSHTSSAGRRPTAGAQSNSSYTPAANVPTVAAAVVDVFSIAAARVRATTNTELLLQRNIFLSTGND
jgi:hypothetical protein